MVWTSDLNRMYSYLVTLVFVGSYWIPKITNISIFCSYVYGNFLLIVDLETTFKIFTQFWGISLFAISAGSSKDMGYVKKINSSCYAIARIKQSMPYSKLLSVYHSLIYYQLSYNVIFFGDSVQSERVHSPKEGAASHVGHHS